MKLALAQASFVVYHALSSTGSSIPSRTSQPVRFVVSTGSEQNDVSLIEQARRQINRLAEEVAHLSETDMAPPDYYSEFLQRILQALAAPAGAIWLMTQQGNLQLQCQVNMRDVGLDQTKEGRASHDEFLRQALTKGQPGMLPPRSGLGSAEGNRAAPGNPTDYLILLAPIMVDKVVAGLVEIWQDPRRGPDAQRGFLQFLVKMAGLAAGYTRNHQLRQMVGQQQVWTQLEAFARQIHNSLNPTEVAYVIANESRRLIECDRVSIALRTGSKVKVEAISGADVVEKRSNLVQLMRKLFDAVMNWGEKLVFNGTKDEALPPAVLAALDEYLAESTSKLLVVMPLRDERETNKKRPPRSGIMVEAFDPSLSSEQSLARLDVISKHATPALYNATEHKRIPFRFLWMPIAKVQEGLGGKAKAIITCVSAALAVLVIAMIVVPYPLKMEAKGQVLPIKRAYVFPPMASTVVKFEEVLKPNVRVTKGQPLALLFAPDIAPEISNLLSQTESARLTMDLIQQVKVNNPNATDQLTPQIKFFDAQSEFRGKTAQLRQLQNLYSIDMQRPGFMVLRSPLDGVVLTPDFKEKFTGLAVKESQPLMRIGSYNPDKNKLSEWEIELKIPQKHIGQVLTAFNNVGPDEELDVDILLSSHPTTMWKGKLARNKIAAEATPNRDDNNESDPVTYAWVRIHSKDGDIPAEYEIPTDMLVADLAVRTRIRCGNRAMGYSLFYGVWEFIYEKIVFFF
jgi:hypothetical protein